MSKLHDVLMELPESDRQLLASLSLFLGSSNIKRLHILFTNHPVEHISWLAEYSRRISAPLSPSDHSSLISIRSRLSCTSSESAVSDLYSSGSVPQQHNSSNEASTTQSRESPPPACYDCVACNVQCTSQVALSRHQREKCERTIQWICYLCPPEKFAAGHPDRLQQHHLVVHGDECQNGCPKGGKLGELSEPCKVELRHSSQQTPNKRAWGCPCCKACFYTFSEWTTHAETHQDQPGCVRKWSFNTAISSLLLHRDLCWATSSYDWQKCNWSGLKKKHCNILKFALERWTLPSDVMAHADYRSLKIQEALALYAFRLGTTGQAFDSRALAVNTVGTSMSMISPPFATSDVPGPSSLNQQYNSAVLQSQYIGNVASSPGLLGYDALSRAVGSHHESLNAHETHFGHMHPSHSGFMGDPCHMILSVHGEQSLGPYTPEAEPNQDFNKGKQRQRSRSHSSPNDKPKRLKAKTSFQNLFNTKGSRTNPLQLLGTPPLIPPPHPTPSRGTAQTIPGSDLDDVLPTPHHDAALPTASNESQIPEVDTILPWGFTIRR